MVNKDEYKTADSD